MTICLYECLKAVGLQRHYARFTLMGVCHADHISGLSMEDYPLLGICSMEDRTRLFHLVQLVKNLDPKSLAYDDGIVCGDDEGDESYSAVGGCSSDDYQNPGEDVNEDQDENGAAISSPNVPSFAKLSHVRRRLDFSDEPTDLQRRLFSHPADTVHAFASHNRNNKHIQEKGSVTPVELQLHSRNALLYGNQESNNCKLDVHSGCCLCNCPSRKSNKLGIRGENSTLNSKTRLPPNTETFNNPKPSPATVMPKTFNNKPFKPKDKNKISRKTNHYTDMAKLIPVYEAKGTAGYNYGLPLSFTHAPHKKQVGGQRISVCVRKRPLIHAECRRGETDVVTTPGGECVIVHESKEAVDLTQYIRQHKFYFDQVFGEESSNEDMYQTTVYPLVQHMLSGGKATCFAYGQTGAGKTYTMLGSSPGKPGLYALAVQDIFTHLSTTYRYSSLLVYVSFFEIYCGQLYDLLDHRKRLFAREDGQKVVHISRLRDVRVDSVSSLLEVISQGTAERTQGVSGVNPLSSRSHALLQIQLRDPNKQITGRMWFVDLAGSERASDAKEHDRQSRIEGAEINQSLLALKECIRSLDKEESHTPFRQSKLTLVLKDSFVGDSMTCMIANISPGHPATEHTLNTLRYADRVKELRGAGGLKGRGSKMVPSSKHCLYKSSGSNRTGTPKNPNLGKQSDIFGFNTPTTKLYTEDRLLCSTPKSNICGEETPSVARKGIGLECITPIRGWLGRNDKCHGRKGANERETRIVENESYGNTHNHCVREKSGRAVLEHENNEQQKQEGARKACLAFTERESGFYHRVKESWQHTMKETRRLETEWIEPSRQVENSRNTSSEVVRQSERGLHIYIDEMERKRHLRHYHQELQQFIPSSASPSVHFSSSPTCQSFSSSAQGSLSSLSAQMYHALEDTSPACRARLARVGYNRGQIPSSGGETHIQTETSSNFCNNKDEDAQGNSGSSEDSMVSLEEIEASFRQDWCENKKRVSSGLVKARGEAKVRRDYERTAGLERRERKCAWVAATEMEPAENKKEAEGLDTSDIPNDGDWRTKQKEAANCYSVGSTYSCNDSNSLCTHLPFEFQHQRAPAERPLSPSEYAYTLLTSNKPSEPSVESKYTRCNANIHTLPLQNTPEVTCQRKKATYSVTNQSTTLPVTIMAKVGCIPAESLNTPSKCSAYTKTYNCPDVNTKKSVLPQDETSVDSFSYIMDPLSISLLQVDQQAATASFLQGNSNTSACPVERVSGETGKECLSCAEMEGKFVEEGDAEFRLSLLELPQEKTLHPAVSDSNHTDRQIYIKNNVCGIGTNKPHNPECTLASNQNRENSQKNHSVPAFNNNVSASPPKAASCASVHTPVRLPSVQHFGNTGLSTFKNPPEYACDENKKHSFSITTQHSGCSSAHSNTLLLDQSSNSKTSPEPNNPAELSRQERLSNQQIRPTVHLLTLDDLNHAKWCIVKAHLEQLKDMEALCHKEKKLLCQQHDMALGEYVHKLAEIMERKARCAHSMKAQLQPYLKPIQSMNSQTQTQRGENYCD
ncbi:uncharacterized protein LOC121648582 [Melanotaenia boesemani]|uniref:uncharacterized protein LOC121648582 n=1 Tax=Melanotaenia boesemani TaxID=1250792 RepID=UPI001C03F8E7|nr:uncharacterized protein LOC121648582 [Melanotaenia boesemani]